jgi:hypothetical protein
MQKFIVFGSERDCCRDRKGIVVGIRKRLWLDFENIRKPEYDSLFWVNSVWV